VAAVSKLGEKHNQRRKQKQKQAAAIITTNTTAPLRSRALETYKKTLRSTKSRDQIHNKLNQVFNVLGILPGSTIEAKAEYFAKKAKNDRWLKDAINRFVEHGNDRVRVKKDLTAVTLGLYFTTIRSFCAMNDLGLTLNWKRIAKELPVGSNEADDKPFTIEQIRRLVTHADRRLKVIVSILCSSGIRAGAFEFLNWGHVEPITNFQYLTWKKRRDQLRGNDEVADKIVIREEEDKQTIIAAMIKVYASEAEQYFGFISPESYHLIKDYIEFRRESGEKIDKDSPLIRNSWKTIDVNNKTKQGRVKNPERQTVGAIEKELARAEKKEGIHTDLPPGVRRHPVKTSHGFRKFWETAADEIGLSDTRVDQLRGDKLSGNRGHYRRPHEYVLLGDYLKMVDLVTIDQDRRKLAQLQTEIAEKDQRQERANYEIMGELTEKDKRLTELEAKYEILQANSASVLNALMAAEMGVKSPEVKLIGWNLKDGQEGLLEAAAMAKAENEAREKKHQQSHHRQQ
jgi:integrase